MRLGGCSSIDPVLVGGLCALACSTTILAQSPTWARQRLEDYEQIKTVSCEVQRVIKSEDQTIRKLSRVYLQRPDHIHVDNVSPLPRRYIADGKNLYYYVQGDPKGFSRPISELDEAWQISLRKVPGTLSDVLMRVADNKQTTLEGTEECPLRLGYEGEAVYTILNIDGDGRLLRVQIYKDSTCEALTAEYSLYDHVEVLPGVFIAQRHEAQVNLLGHSTTETTRIRKLVVNEPIPAALFDAAPYFKEVVFVDDFSKIYGDQ